jgi:hypothetical protein
MNPTWNMPKKPQKNSTIDRQKGKGNIERDEDITFLLGGGKLHKYTTSSCKWNKG